MHACPNPVGLAERSWLLYECSKEERDWKFDVLAPSETTLRGGGGCEFVVVSGWKLGGRLSKGRCGVIK